MIMLIRHCALCAVYRGYLITLSVKSRTAQTSEFLTTLRIINWISNNKFWCSKFLDIFLQSNAENLDKEQKYSWSDLIKAEKVEKRLENATAKFVERMDSETLWQKDEQTSKSRVKRKGGQRNKKILEDLKSPPKDTKTTKQFYYTGKWWRYSSSIIFLLLCPNNVKCTKASIMEWLFSHMRQLWSLNPVRQIRCIAANVCYSCSIFESSCVALVLWRTPQTAAFWVKYNFSTYRHRCAFALVLVNWARTGEGSSVCFEAPDCLPETYCELLKDARRRGEYVEARWDREATSSKHRHYGSLQQPERRK